MSTNKQAFKKAFVKEKSVNYNIVLRRYGYNSLDEVEYLKLIKFLKPLYTVLDNDFIIFKYVKQNKLLKLI